MRTVSSIRIPSLLAGIPLLFTFACATSNPVMLQRTQELAATHANHDLPAPSSYEVPDWKAGSWMIQRTTQNGKVSVMRMDILESNVAGVLVQSEMQDDQQRTRTLTRYSRMPRNGEEAGDLLQRVVSQTNDDAPIVTDFSDPGMAMAKGFYKAVSITGPAFAEVASLPREDVSSPAGRFAGAVRHTSSVSVGPFRQDVEGWWHPGVPVSGTIRSQTPDGKHVTELLDFGWTGAKQVLFDPGQ